MRLLFILKWQYSLLKTQIAGQTYGGFFYLKMAKLTSSCLLYTSDILHKYIRGGIAKINMFKVDSACMRYRIRGKMCIRDRVTALSDVNFTIEKGDIFGIIGFSGAGKSTLLRMINALEVPTSGHVEIDGVNINGLSFNYLRKVRKRIGMVFQQFNLLNAKSVHDNVAIPLILNKVPKSEIDKKVKTLLDLSLIHI